MHDPSKYRLGKVDLFQVQLRQGLVDESVTFEAGGQSGLDIPLEVDADMVRFARADLAVIIHKLRNFPGVPVFCQVGAILPAWKQPVNVPNTRQHSAAP